MQVELSNGILVFSKALVDSILDVLVGAQTWNVFRGHLVDQFLKFVRVALGFCEVLCITESDVLETVDLTELPEDRVGVLAGALDSENLGEVSLLRDALDHVLEKLGLGQGVFVVHGQVVQELVLG